MAVYLQLKESIEKKIRDGVYKVGDKIPSERQMSELYGITRVTVKHAIRMLEEEGVLCSKQGKGTFVVDTPQSNKKIELGMNATGQLSLDIRIGGMFPSKVVLSLKSGIVDELPVSFDPENRYVELVRLLRADEIPYALQIAYLPYSLFYDAERHNFRDNSLYDYMDGRGHRPRKIESELVVGKVPPRYAKYLNISEEKNVFQFTYKGYDKDNVLVEYTKSYNLPEYTSFKYETIKNVK